MSKFEQTWKKAQEQWPFIDPACRDKARFFYPCCEIVSVNLTGKLFPTVDIKLKKDTNAAAPACALASDEIASELPLHRRTLNFIATGLHPEGWHREFFLATVDLNEKKFSQSRAIEMLTKITGHLDETDLYQINHIYTQYEGLDLPPPESVSDDRVVKTSAALSGGTFTRLSVEDRLRQYDAEKKIRETATLNPVPFICKNFPRPLTQGFNLVGSCSGGGKTTTLCNVLATFFEGVKDKKALVTSGEESTEIISNKTACIILDTDWQAFRNDKLPKEEKLAVENTARNILTRIEIVNGDGSSDVTYLENIIAALEAAAKDPEIGLICCDYYQTIEFSLNHPEWDRYRVYKRFGTYLRDYSPRVAKPVVVFAQLRPQSESLLFSDRIEGDKTVFNHSTAAFELKPNYTEQYTDVIIQKDRYQDMRGLNVRLFWDKGCKYFL
jgi:hypothetical protein